MRQLIPTMIAVHWSGVFGLLAFRCVADPDTGTAAVLRAIGLVPPSGGVGATASAAALLGLLFALAALLFLWMLASCLLSPGDRRVAKSVRSAFSCGLSALLVLLCLGYAAVPEGGGALVAVECMVAALVACYLAVCGEQSHSVSDGRRREAAAIARRMALEAAGRSLLSHLSGRAGETPSGRF